MKFFSSFHSKSKLTSSSGTSEIPVKKSMFFEEDLKPSEENKRENSVESSPRTILTQSSKSATSRLSDSTTSSECDSPSRGSQSCAVRKSLFFEAMNNAMNNLSEQRIQETSGPVLRPTELIIPTVHSEIVNPPDNINPLDPVHIEAQQKFAMTYFFREKILCTQANSLRYADMVFKNGITDIECLERRLQRDPEFLLKIGMDEQDAEEVAEHFVMQKNTSNNQSRSKKSLLRLDSNLSATSSMFDSFYSVGAASPMSRVTSPRSGEREESILNSEIAKLYYDSSQCQIFEALQQLKELAVDGNLLAQAFLMRMYAIGQGSIKKDQNKARAMADKVYPYLSAVVMRKETDKITLMYTRYLMGVCISEGLGTDQDHEAALPWYKLSAEHGYAAAQAYLGTCYYDGVGVAVDYNEAVRWYRLAAQQGFASAQCNLGLCYEQGHGVPQNNIEAVKWYRLGANQGHGASRYNLGYCYEKGIGLERNYVEAINLYIESAEKDYSPAQYILGTFYATGRYHLPMDPEKSFRWFLRSAESGHTVGMYKTAVNYEQGLGVEANLEEALIWYRKSGREGHMPSRIKVVLISSALGIDTKKTGDSGGSDSHNSSTSSQQFEQMLQNISNSENLCASPKNVSSNGSAMSSSFLTDPSMEGEELLDMEPADALYELGLCYEQGKGVEPDYEAALQWYTVSATDGGHADSQFRLGLYHELGTNGAEKDIFQALTWYRKAAEHGHPVAQYKLGMCHEKGTASCEVNESTAVSYYKQSAEKGYAPAQHQLGLCYFNGYGGLKKSMKEAVHWYQLGAEQGYPPAINSLGFCHFSGHFLPKNVKVGIKLYKLAADAGYVVALNNLGHCYLQGTGVYKNEVMAFRLFKIAAKLGYAPSQNNVGNCYFDGIGVTKSQELAFGWYKLAADQDYTTAQYNMGYCCEKGYGTKKNLMQAIRLYHVAAMKGNRKAIIAIRKFPDSLSNASKQKKKSEAKKK